MGLICMLSEKTQLLGDALNHLQLILLTYSHKYECDVGEDVCLGDFLYTFKN